MKGVKGEGKLVVEGVAVVSLELEIVTHTRDAPLRQCGQMHNPFPHPEHWIVG